MDLNAAKVHRAGYQLPEAVIRREGPRLGGSETCDVEIKSPDDHRYSPSCGRCAVWLADRRLTCWGLDISGVAVDLAQKLADRSVGDRCRFDVVDLDDGLPDRPPVDVMLCHFFRDARLDRFLVERLLPGGLLAIAAVSEVDVGPGHSGGPPVNCGPPSPALS